MPLPTLLIKGHLKALDSNKQKELDDWIPIEYIITWFKQRANLQGIENRVLILKSETASGKTTTLPVYIYNNFMLDRRNIAVTQPRVITAIKNVIEIANIPSNKNIEIGENIGWQTKVYKKTIKLGGIIFMTIGVLALQLKILSDDEFIKKYNFIILDEVHEMSKEMAQVLLNMKKFLLRNKDNPKLPFLICASATIDEDKYLNYFQLSKSTNFIFAEGISYPRKTIFLNKPVENYLKGAVDMVKKIHMHGLKDENNKSDILIFLPGVGEMVKIERELKDINSKYANENIPIFDILKLDSSAINYNTQEYVRAFIPTNKLKVDIDGKSMTPIRKIIMSTNVAETGLTLDSLKYVIDCGYHRGIEFYSSIGAYALLDKPADKSRITQRKGRIGRKFPGEFYPLYTEEIYNKLPCQQFSEIVLNDTTLIILNNIDIEKNNFKASKLDLIEKIPPDNIHYSIEKLYLLGFCDHNGQITELGSLANKFTIYEPEIIRTILSAYFWGCNILDIISIMAYIQITPKDMMSTMKDIDWIYVYKNSLPVYLLGGDITGKLIFKMQLLIADDFINGLFLFTAIGNLIRKSKNDEIYKNLMDFSEKTNIKYDTIINYIKIRDDIIEQMLNIGLKVDLKIGDKTSFIYAEEEQFINELIKIKYCIFEGYRMNMAKYNTANGKYEIKSYPIAMPKMFIDNEITREKRKEYGLEYKNYPKYILYDKLNIKYNNKNKLYGLKVNHISVLDGFVNVDLNY